MNVLQLGDDVLPIISYTDWENSNILRSDMNINHNSCSRCFLRRTQTFVARKTLTDYLLIVWRMSYDRGRISRT